MTDHTHELVHKSDPGLDRLLFFSDGVFAIAITLLAIELHVPHGWDGHAATLFRESWQMLAAFALSFAVVGIFWNSHRRLFLGMQRFTVGVFVLNLILLAGIALMPFASVLLYSPPVTIETFGLYLGLVSAIGLANGLAQAYAYFVADVIRPKRPFALRLAATLMQTFMPAACCGLALALSVQAPLWIIAPLALIVAGLTGFLIWARRRAAA